MEAVLALKGSIAANRVGRAAATAAPRVASLPNTLAQPASGNLSRWAELPGGCPPRQGIQAGRPSRWGVYPGGMSSQVGRPSSWGVLPGRESILVGRPSRRVSILAGCHSSRCPHLYATQLPVLGEQVLCPQITT